MSGREVSLFEWEKEDIPDISFSSDRIRKLAGLLDAKRIVSITELRTGIRVECNSHIGQVDMGDFTLHIKPKLDGLPLLRLLSYAYDLRDLKLYDRAVYRVGLSGWFDWLIYALHAVIDKLWRQGLAKGYMPREERLEALRGRIDFGKIAGNGGLIGSALPCRYHFREEDTELNRTILAGLTLAQNIALDLDLKYTLARTIKSLKEFINQEKLDRQRLDKAYAGLNRLTEDYRPILDIIDILYKSQAPLLDNDNRSVPLPGFFFDMNLFFEALIKRLLKLLPEEITVQDQYSLKYLMAYDPSYNPRRKTNPLPRPDFALLKAKRVVRLLDAKYRDLWEKPLPGHMLYQLAVYALSGLGEEKRATIIYPALDDGPEMQIINIFDVQNGEKQGFVDMAPLNLQKIAKYLGTGEEGELALYLQKAILTEPGS